MSAMIPTRERAIVRRAKTLSIMPTNTCPASCANCGSLSGPGEKGGLTLDTMLTAIQEAKELGFYNVVFTGGEATLRWPDLLRAIRYATDIGFPTRIVTNAHWATNTHQAGRKIDALMAAGLKEINYSTGDEHARFIPVDRIINAIVASTSRSLWTSVVVELRARRTVTKATLEDDPRLRALPDDQRKWLDIFEGPWMPLDPHATTDYTEHLTTNGRNVGSRCGCTSLLQTYTLQSDGGIAACCGIGQRLIPELTVARATGKGALRTAMERAENDFIKLWIHYLGPEKILAWASAKDPSIQWEGMYAHHCQACARVYKDQKVADLVRRHYPEMMATVVQAAWLDERHVPNLFALSAREDANFLASESGDFSQKSDTARIPTIDCPD